jgi:hypothetical protein
MERVTNSHQMHACRTEIRLSSPRHKTARVCICICVCVPKCVCIRNQGNDRQQNQTKQHNTFCSISHLDTSLPLCQLDK